MKPLKAKLLQLEHTEEALVILALEAGLECHRLVYASAHALLSVEPMDAETPKDQPEDSASKVSQLSEESREELFKPEADDGAAVNPNGSVTRRPIHPRTMRAAE